MSIVAGQLQASGLRSNDQIERRTTWRPAIRIVTESLFLACGSSLKTVRKFRGRYFRPMRRVTFSSSVGLEFPCPPHALQIKNPAWTRSPGRFRVHTTCATVRHNCRRSSVISSHLAKLSASIDTDSSTLSSRYTSLVLSLL